MGYKPSTEGFSKSGTDKRGNSGAAQDMYDKDKYYEGNMGKNMTPGKSYEPSHVMNKKTGDIPGAGIC